ncbi:MAG TPA: LacI family DNA-binding transcriptional regulator [Mobilitalea sp.]|nr:LacI family DNA-binding transcriptional regulator [Mobilitalea sp.]
MTDSNNGNKKITIKEVAKEAGVAISTVSNALNGSELVNEETRSKILAVAEKLNYIPNLNGRFLKSGKTKTLGFITSSVRGQYFYVLADAMCRECDRLGYTLNIIVTRDKNVIMNNILGKSFDGIFIFEGERIGEPELEMIEKSNIKIVLLDRYYERKNISSVIFDSYKAGYEAARYLINLGHKNIFFIEGAGDVYDSIERKRGYIEAMKEYNIEFREDYVIFGMFEELFTYNAVISLLRLKERLLPDAFIGGNDLSAIGCMKALQSMGYSIPDDVSVVGFDDIEISEYFKPSLTTIKNPIDNQGTSAVRLMMKMINDNQDGKVEILSGKLIPRNSSGINRR